MERVPVLVITGEITGAEDLTIEGQVVGSIRLGEHALTVAPGAAVQAEIVARRVTIQGSVNGRVFGETVDIHATGSLEGDIVTPRIVMADGAHFKGRVETPPRSAES
jgi:cytoskeletal protein CcmA (bactofilin family)